VAREKYSAWAIRHPVMPIVLFVVLFFVGVVDFIRLPVNLDPDITFPMVNVTVAQPGAAPTEMETQIAQKIEGSISSIGNVRNITTYIVEGSGRNQRAVPDRHAGRSGRDRRARCGRQGAQRLAAGDHRTASAARELQRSVRVLRGHDDQHVARGS
jgi:hypothetical protein